MSRKEMMRQLGVPGRSLWDRPRAWSAWSCWPTGACPSTAFQIYLTEVKQNNCFEFPSLRQALQNIRAKL